MSLDNPRVGITEVTGDNMIDFIYTPDGENLGYCQQKWEIQDGEEVSTWSDYKELEPFPDNIDLANKNLKFIDISGDGSLDILRVTPHFIMVYSLINKVGYKYEELDSAKKEWLQMRNKIAKLEGEKEDLNVRVGILESYVNDGKINKQPQQEVLEEIRKMIERTYYLYFWVKFVYALLIERRLATYSQTWFSDHLY